MAHRAPPIRKNGGHIIPRRFGRSRTRAKCFPSYARAPARLLGRATGRESRHVMPSPVRGNGFFAQLLLPVPGSPAGFPNGLRCDHSPFEYGDILPEHPEHSDRPGTWVVEIKRILEPNGHVFGFVYRMKDGIQLPQVVPGSSPTARRLLNVSPLQLRRLPAKLPFHLRVEPFPASLLKMERG